MKRLLLLLVSVSSLLAAPGAAILTDDVYQLPPGDWRWVRFEIRHRPATAECRFDNVGGTGSIQAELVSRNDLELFRAHKPHDALAYTEPRVSGAVSQYIQDPGEYAAIIENKDSRPIAVHLKVSLAFGPPQPVARYLSPQRRLTVILVSFAMFFAIVTFSTRALLKAMKKP